MCIRDRYVNYVKRLRDENGIKFQVVIHDPENEIPADYEGCIRVPNKVADGSESVSYTHLIKSISLDLATM